MGHDRHCPWPNPCSTVAELGAAASAPRSVEVADGSELVLIAIVAGLPWSALRARSPALLYLMR